jgi:hypothetical protein
MCQTTLESTEKRSGKEGVNQQSADFFQKRIVQKWPQTRADEGARQSGEHWQKGRPLQDQRRRHHGQKQVLNHVDAQQPRGKGIERRSQCEIYDDQADEK